MSMICSFVWDAGGMALFFATELGVILIALISRRLFSEAVAAAYPSTALLS